MSNLFPTTTEIEQSLNELYFKFPLKYQEYLAQVKSSGYKVMRNSKGIHKVSTDAKQDFSNIFGDIFGNYFGSWQTTKYMLYYISIGGT